MSSQQPPLGSPVPESDGDVDTFAWRNVTPRTRLAMKRLLGLSGDSDIALAARFGTPPSAEVVDPCWTVLRDTWLASTSAAPARSRIIAALRTAGIGDPASETSTHAGELAHLESLHPTPELRNAVHTEFLLLGLHRRTMSDDDIARYCSLYRAGHTPHYIQVFKALRDTDHPAIPCTIVKVANNGMVTVRANGTDQRLWNHDPARLRRIAASGGAAKLHLRWALLTIDSPNGTFNFSMQLNETSSSKSK